MSERTQRWLRVVAIVIMSVIVVYGIIAINLYSSVGRFPSGYARPVPHIRDLVWPTVGFPELVEPGDTLEAEFRIPRDTQATPTFTATLEPVRTELDGLSYPLTQKSAVSGSSKHWPKGTTQSRVDLWTVEFAVPPGAVPELYDLTVSATADGTVFSDSEPHAVSLLAGPADDFRFISISDIHVHLRNTSSFKMPQSDKGIAPDGTPLFFEEAIDQINLIRPDFAVILGDNVRAQHAPGDLAAEFSLFYEALYRFRVPVFILAGNHDQYYNEIDGAKLFEENIGPLFYSFDAGKAHFTAANTSDWPARDRMLMQKFGTFVYPRKWQGQVRGASDERKPDTYRSQLAWLRNDLAASAPAETKFMLMHHDPFRPDGRPTAWKNDRFAGVFTLGGGGSGSLALRTLAARDQVDYVLSGHAHSDYVGSKEWVGGGGLTDYINQTMVTFDEGGMKDSYPGYRLWNVAGGKVTGYSYTDSYHSMPFYDGSVIGGMTDLDSLDTPALSEKRTASPPGFTVTSYLEVPVEVRGLVGVFPEGGSAPVNGGATYQSVPYPRGAGMSVIYIRTTVPAGKQSAGSTKGVPAQQVVEVGAGT